MIHGNFADAIAVSSRQHGNETVHFPVELHILKYLATVDLQSTVVIMELEPR